MDRSRQPARATSLRVRRAISSACTFENLEPRQLLSVNVAINTAKHFQTIDGFGTSLGGGTNLRDLSSKKLQKLYWQDLGSSMLRVDLHNHVLSAKPGDWKTPVYMGPNIQKNIALMNFENYDVLTNGVMARSSLTYGDSDTKIIGSIWTPPHWMKGATVNWKTNQPTQNYPYINYNGSSCGGSLIDTPANLTQFGRYVAAYVKGFEQAFGVHMYAISIQNELNFFEPYSSCVYSPQLYVDAIKGVKRAFDLNGITTKLIGPEDVGVGSTDQPSILYRQMAYIDAIRKDPVAMAAVDGYAIHGYANDGTTPTRSPDMWSNYWDGGIGIKGIKNDDKPSWMTETSGGFNTWATAMKMTGNVLDALVQGNVSAWVYWGITTDKADQHDYALMMNQDPKSTRYVAAKHFFKYIRPGAVRVATSNEDPSGIYSAAFVHDKDKTLTTVIANESDKEQTVNLSVPNTNISQFDIGYESTGSKEWVKLKTLRMSNGVVKITLPAKSLITLQASTAPRAAAIRVAPGKINGIYFNDTNKNHKLNSAEARLGGDAIYLDLNKNGAYDKGEPRTIADASGAFSFSNLRSGTYSVRRDLPAGWTRTTNTTAIPVTSGKRTSIIIGVAETNPGKASISGLAFNDTDANGTFNTRDTIGIDKTIFLDTNNNGKLDPGEITTKSDRRGYFSFTGLSPGTYHVARVFYTGYAVSTPPATVKVKAGQTFSGVAIGARVA